MNKANKVLISGYKNNNEKQTEMGDRLPKAFPGCTELNVEGATFSRLPFLFSPACMP